LSLGLERIPQFPRNDVIGDVVHPFVAELAVPQPGDSVVLVEPLLRLCRRFDMPGDQILGDATGDLMGEDGLAGPGFAFDEKRAFERNRRVDRDPQILRRHIGVGAFETLHPRRFPRHGHVHIAKGAA
jgi:hypothetical protein